jgi:hypothetical protein
MSIARTLMIALIGLGSLPADDAPLPEAARSALTDSRARVRKARAAFLAELRAETARLEAALKKEQEIATKAGDLDGALAIRERIERLRAGELMDLVEIGPDDLMEADASPPVTRAAVRSFVWAGNDEDRVGRGGPIGPDGQKDERFDLVLLLPTNTTIRSIAVRADNRHGHWVTNPEVGRWPSCSRAGASSRSRPRRSESSRGESSSAST